MARSRSREREECLQSGSIPPVPLRTQVTHSPGGERSKRRPETSHPPLPSFPEGLFHQFALRSRIQPPKTPLSRLVLRAGHFQKVAVEREVVSDGVLQSTKHHKWLGGFLTVHNFPIILIKMHQSSSPGLKMLNGPFLRNIKYFSCQPSSKFGLL